MRYDLNLNKNGQQGIGIKKWLQLTVYFGRNIHRDPCARWVKGRKGPHNNQAQAHGRDRKKKQILAELASKIRSTPLFSLLSTLRLSLCVLLRPEKIRPACRVRRLWNTGRLRLKL